MEAKFAELHQSALAAADSAEARKTNINKQTAELADAVKRIDAILALLADPFPPPGTDPAALKAELAALRPCADALEKTLDGMEVTTEPPLTVLDEALEYHGARPYIPAENTPADPRPPPNPDSWKESNYERFAERTALCFPPPIGKVPLESLLTQMDEPANSKIMLPRPLELYSTDELKCTKKDRTASDWLNRHADPIEPFKCWSTDEFSQVYNGPGFHFLFARVAQIGAQSRDAKLPALQKMLAARWETQVKFETIPPRQDWMLCTVPSSDGLTPDRRASDPPVRSTRPRIHGPQHRGHQRRDLRAAQETPAGVRGRWRLPRLARPRRPEGQRPQQVPRDLPAGEAHVLLVSRSVSLHPFILIYFHSFPFISVHPFIHSCSPYVFRSRTPTLSFSFPPDSRSTPRPLSTSCALAPGRSVSLLSAIAT